MCEDCTAPYIAQCSQCLKEVEIGRPDPKWVKEHGYSTSHSFEEYGDVYCEWWIEKNGWDMSDDLLCPDCKKEHSDAN